MIHEILIYKIKIICAKLQTIIQLNELNIKCFYRIIDFISNN